MRFTNKYFGLVLLHIIIGIVFFLIPTFSKLFGLLFPVAGLLLVLRTQNKNNQVLLVMAYAVGAEVLLRMTNGNILYELTKYTLIIFSTLGVYYSGVSKRVWIYFIFLFLLIPGIYIGATELRFDVDVRKAIIFNILGEIALFFCALYCFERKIKFTELEYLLKALSLPIISTVVYLFLFSPTIKDVVTGTQSNFETSGGFGPNQVATILGLGMFCFFSLLVLFSKSKTDKIINLFMLIFISYRGIVTFSRGGIITALIMIIVFVLFLFKYSKSQTRGKIIVISCFGLIISGAIWFYSVSQTDGLIENRYQNKDARGRVKEDNLGGREQIAETELQMFIENPILGIGVGRNKQYREETTGIIAASHNETTRLLAEHGMFGVFALLLLIIVPLVHWFGNKAHIFLIPFYIFWALTISHAAMRLAAPAFIYALTLLQVTISNDKATLHRESTT